MAAVMFGAIASTVSAQAALPYKAYGSGMKAGAKVEAFKGTAVVGTATVDAAGNWSIDIQPGGTANVANGDAISFKLDGANTAQTVTFQPASSPPLRVLR